MQPFKQSASGSKIIQYLEDICAGKWDKPDYISPWAIQDRAIETLEPETRKYLVKYCAQNHDHIKGIDIYSEIIIEAIDPIHCEQLFWDEVRVTDKSPLQWASSVESIRMI